GQMNFFGHQAGNADAYYEPNSFGGPVEDPAFAEPPLRISGEAGRHPHQQQLDDYVQPRALHDSVLTEEERGRLYRNLAAAMEGADEAIVERALMHFDRISPDYGAGIRAARAALAQRHRHAAE
ncbi:MAG: catalase, partial [Alphaproteobacteria bacterium]|nr:catalase [Alphaproteobacteria bacterium]